MRDSSTSIGSPSPQAVTIGGAPYRLVAFYYPDRNTAWDDVYRAPWLGNFWPCRIILAHAGVSQTFRTGEAAFQSTKWWADASVRRTFGEQPTGTAAFHYKNGLSDPDPSYAGLGRDGAMMAVLEAKFADPELRQALLATGGAYLLEHNEEHGRDSYWSDDHDGTGSNRLGVSLMALRKQLGGSPAPAGTYTVADFTRAVRTTS